ncbi:MAG: FliA/WhiG family RNA polymerase sigma factor [Solirubrobacterales bacterium]
MKPDFGALWQQYKEQEDYAARDELIVYYTYLVKYIANRLAINLSSMVEIDDLISYGVEGLIDAVEKFDHTRNIKFETYAMSRIKGAMIDGLRAMDWVPVSVRQKSKDLEKAYAMVEHELGRPATDDEMAKALGMKEEEFRKLLSDVSVTTIVYLEDFLSGEDNGEKSKRIGDYLKDDHVENALVLVEIAETKELLGEAIGKLPEKEKMVIYMYYYEGLTLKEIGEVLSLSESRISQLHTKSILRLRGRLSRRKNQML